MLSRSVKKKLSKRNVSKSQCKSKCCIPQKQHLIITVRSLNHLNFFLLMKKYVQKHLHPELIQSVNQFIFNREKITIQLRFQTSEKEFMVGFNANLATVIRRKGEPLQTEKKGFRPQIISQETITDILHSHRQRKDNFLSKLGRKKEFQKRHEKKAEQIKTENSFMCLKTLIGRISKMIQNQKYSDSTNDTILDVGDVQKRQAQNHALCFPESSINFASAHQHKNQLAKVEKSKSKIKHARKSTKEIRYFRTQIKNEQRIKNGEEYERVKKKEKRRKKNEQRSQNRLPRASCGRIIKKGKGANEKGDDGKGKKSIKLMKIQQFSLK